MTSKTKKFLFELYKLLEKHNAVIEIGEPDGYIDGESPWINVEVGGQGEDIVDVGNYISTKSLKDLIVEEPKLYVDEQDIEN